jgi:RNA polymerase sigma factor (sigma-70 family)
LVERHWPTVNALARRLCGNAAMGTEAAQEATVAALVSLPRLRSPERFGAWYAGIALNLAGNWLRQRIDTVALSADYRDDQPGPDEYVEQAELAKRVRQAVDGLAPGQRQAVLAFYWQALTHAEASTELDISPNAVKARLHQARAGLRSRLADNLDDKEVPPMPATAEPSWVAVQVAEIRRSRGEDPNRRLHVVVLKGQGGDRQLPIYVAAPEATAMACTLKAVEMPRPMTYQFALNLTEASGARVVDVRITRLTPPTFYAVVRVDGPAGTVEVDARPSDALNLALVAGAPIFVDHSIFDHEGPFIHPNWQTAWEGFPAGAATIVAEIRDRQTELGTRPDVAGLTPLAEPPPDGPHR